MAIFIPPRPSSPSVGDSGIRSFAQREWRDSHIRETLEHMEAGRLGNYKPHQIEGVRNILAEAAGADKNLSPSQVKAAIHKIDMERHNIGLDSDQAEHIMTHLANGPQE